jgi:hypothetical protein
MALKPGTLENPSLWRKIHNLWIGEVCQSLKPQVRGRLSISIGEEVTLLEVGGGRTRVYPDVHLAGGDARVGPTASTLAATGAVAHAAGVEDWSRETRHYIALHDLAGERVVAILEILSPTNKGFYANADYEAFRDRRQRLLSSCISYMEVDAVPFGTRWLPRSLADLAAYPGVVWTSTPQDDAGRSVEGWAWAAGGPLPRVPWELGAHGRVEVDLETSFNEAAVTAGLTV